MMNILFLHGVSAFGGSTKSLVELFTQLKRQNVTGTVICPKGKSEQALSAIGFKTIPALGIAQFDNTRYGYYRGFRWSILLRECLFLVPTLLALLKARRHAKSFDVIHANEITLLPIAVLAKKIFKCPLVVHIRSVQRGDAADRRTKVLFNFLKKHANAVIAIDDTVNASLPDFINASIIHNGLNIEKQTQQPYEKTRSEIPSVGIVGSLLRLKGIYEFLEAARILTNERNLKIKWLVVGENARTTKGFMAWLYKRLGFSDDVMRDMKHFIETHNLQHAIEIKGFVQDVREIYTELDILTFPSYLNAVGRPVFEAALFGIPSIVCVRNPKPDTMIHDVTGLCIETPDPILLANSIEILATDSQKRVQLGNNAYLQASTQFDMAKNALLVLEIYKKLIGP